MANIYKNASFPQYEEYPHMTDVYQICHTWKSGLREKCMWQIQENSIFYTSGNEYKAMAI
jgi:hypothetical protein